MSFSIAGKTAVVTGAANGVGLAVARHFSECGANVMFADMDEEKLIEEIGQVSEDETGNIDYFVGDLREKLTVANLLSATIDRFERADILVNASRQMLSSDPLNPDEPDAALSALGRAALDYARRGWMIFPVAPVGEAVDPERNVPGDRSEERREVPEVTVNAAVRHEPGDMEHAAALPDSPHEALETEALGEAPVFDGAIDPGDVLIDDAPCAQVEMADLRVSHLPGGEAHVGSRAGESGPRAFRVDAAESGHSGQLHRVAPARRIREVGVTPAVENDQQDFTHLRHLWAESGGSRGAPESNRAHDPINAVVYRNARHP